MDDEKFHINNKKFSHRYRDKHTNSLGFLFCFLWWRCEENHFILTNPQTVVSQKLIMEAIQTSVQPQTQLTELYRSNTLSLRC